MASPADKPQGDVGDVKVEEGDVKRDLGDEKRDLGDVKGDAEITTEERIDIRIRQETQIEAKVSLDETYHPDIETIRREPPKDEEPRVFFGVDPTRKHWTNRVTYLCVMALSVTTIFNMYSHGFSFIFTYLILMGMLGYPLHLLMSALGIYAQRNLVRAWDGAPIARGVAWAMFAFAVLFLWFYGFYGAYGLTYFSYCFNSPIPWQKNITGDEEEEVCTKICETDLVVSPPKQGPFSKASAFFYSHILLFGKFDKIWLPGDSINIRLLIAYIILWMCVILIVMKSIVSIGKLVYFLLPCIYVFGMMLLVLSFLLRKSEGYSLMFSNFQNVAKSLVWRDAAEQVLLELGIVFGIPFLYGSYCNFYNPIILDSAIVCAISVMNSILSALMFFGALGCVRYYNTAPLEEIKQIGAGVLYVVYADAFTVPVIAPQLWCASFGLFFFLVCISAMIGPLFVVCTIIADMLPEKKIKEWIVFLALGLTIFLLGIYFAFCKTFYVILFLSWLPGISPILVIVFFYVFFMLLYGIHKLSEDIHFSCEWEPSAIFKYYLLFIPVPLFLIFVISIAFDHYKIIFHDNEYDGITKLIGWALFGIIISLIIIFMLAWIIKCAIRKRSDEILKSKETWGPKHILGRYARARFSSEG